MGNGCLCVANKHIVNDKAPLTGRSPKCLIQEDPLKEIDIEAFTMTTIIKKNPYHLG